MKKLAEVLIVIILLLDITKICVNDLETKAFFDWISDVLARFVVFILFNQIQKHNP